jgi:hypothetical protein
VDVLTAIPASLSFFRVLYPLLAIPGRRRNSHARTRRHRRCSIPGGRRRVATIPVLLGRGLALAEPAQDVGLLCAEADGGEHGGPAVARGAADGAAALGPDVRLAVHEEEHDLARARPQLHQRVPALHDPAAVLLAGAICMHSHVRKRTLSVTD